jgi:hypothetical protein
MKTQEAKKKENPIETAARRLARVGCRVRTRGAMFVIVIPREGMGIHSWGVADYLVAQGQRVERAS